MMAKGTKKTTRNARAVGSHMYMLGARAVESLVTVVLEVANGRI